MLYRLIFILFILLTTNVFSQNRYVVHIKDKTNSPYSISNPLEFLSQRALDRREKYSIPITEEDFPVNPAYLTELKNAGAEVFFNSRWLNVVLIQADAALVSELEGLTFVDHVELVSNGERLANGRIEHNEGTEEKEAFENAVQNDMLGIYSLHDQELFGDGILMAFLDGGFLGVESQEAFGHLFDNSQIIDQFNYLDNNQEVFQYDTHGTKVFSTVAAYLDGIYQGIAPNAEFLLYITEEVRNTLNSYSETPIEEYNMLFATERADSAGADIISTSLGYSTFDSPFSSYSYSDMDGSTTIVTQAFEKAFEKGAFVITSAGNEGGGSWQYITAPADGPHVMSVGAVFDNGSRVSSSSIGPNANGVIKPEVMALGNSTSLISNAGVTSGNGTSYAAPQVAGLACLLWQKNAELTNQELFDLILSLGNNFNNPNNEIGYGIPSAARLITSVEDGIHNVRVYPNPFTSYVTIEKGRMFDEFTLINTLGQTYNLKPLNDDINSLSFDVDHVPSGFYVLKLTSQNTDQIIKLIKN